MNIADHPLSWYVDKLKNGDFFSLVSMGDGEWIAAMGKQIGGVNAENSSYTEQLRDGLLEVCGFKDPRFFFSTPADLKWTGLIPEINTWLKLHEITMEFVEKDVWNKAVREGNLGPFIQQLQKMPVTVVSNEAMRGLYFLRYEGFVEVRYPEASLDLERAVSEAVALHRPGMVYVVAMGLSGPVFVKRLFEQVGQDCFILEVGSVFDFFVGTGGQRGWRAEIYGNTQKLLELRKKNLTYECGDQGLDRPADDPPA